MECCGQCFVVTNVIAIFCFASQYEQQWIRHTFKSEGGFYPRAIMGMLNNWGVVNDDTMFEELQPGEVDNVVNFPSVVISPT